MKAYCDLHIHSCLSPCAEDDMTPWNVVGMAKVKGLDVIALTDHNAALNVPEAVKAGERYGVTVIPGLETTTREEAHILTYFANAASALAFGEAVFSRLPDVRNKPSLFGNQIIIGENDEPTGTADRLLIGATDLTLDELCALAEQYGGVCVPAHINRGSNGLLGALGLMPPLPAFPTVEVAPGLDCPRVATEGRLALCSSDAHRLEDIAERGFALEVPAITAEAVLALLKRGNNT
jgi:3',5'-nucleoside bisphosphate phosphatase